MSVAVRSVSLLSIFTGVLSFLLALPLFILAYPSIPELEWPYHSDKLLVFFLIAVALLLIAQSFRYLIVGAVFMLLLWLTYGTFTNKYGFEKFFNDSKTVLYGLKNIDQANTHVVFTGTRSLSTDAEIIRAIDFKDAAVRTFAVDATNQFFKKEQQLKNNQYRMLVQSFAVFKKINNNWNYVNDPQDNEYIAKASESVKLLAGDCDDHSILMAAAIKSIGGITRLVYTEGHIYPEILIGGKKDFDYMANLIRKKLFAAESAGMPLHYHKDEKGQYWMNLDYTAHYPGGNFMRQDVIECLYP